MHAYTVGRFIAARLYELGKGSFRARLERSGYRDLEPTPRHTRHWANR